MGLFMRSRFAWKEERVTGVNNSKSMPKNVINSQRSVAIDFLRVVAIVAVVCVHSLPVPIISGGGGFFASAELVRSLKSVCRCS